MGPRVSGSASVVPGRERITAEPQRTEPGAFRFVALEIWAAGEDCSDCGLQLRSCCCQPSLQLLGHLPQPGSFVLQGGQSQKPVNNPPIRSSPSPFPRWPALAPALGKGAGPSSGTGRPPVPSARGCRFPQNHPSRRPGTVSEDFGRQSRPPAGEKTERETVPFVLQELY